MSFKSWIAEKALEGKLPNWIYRFIGREIAEKMGMEDSMADETVDVKPWYKSKGKLAAIIGALLAAVTPISTAFGHPIVVPNWVLEVLAGIGLYGIRDSIKA